MLRIDSCRRAANAANAENWSVSSLRMGPRMRRTTPKWSTAAPSAAPISLGLVRTMSQAKNAISTGAVRTVPTIVSSPSVADRVSVSTRETSSPVR